MKEVTVEMIEALRKPLPEKAITQHPTKTYLSSIKPPYVIERLNEVFGLNGWSDEYEIVSAQAQEVIAKAGTPKERKYTAMTVVAKGILRMEEYGIVRTAYGGNDQEDFGDAYKGACTDCLTKMAMQVYIGMDVYKGLGAKSDYKPEPAKRDQYQTVEAILEKKTTDEHGYWFKIGEFTIFKDEASPVDASPLYEAALGSIAKVRVIERKNNGQRTFYELAEVLGEVQPPSDAPTATPAPAASPVREGKPITPGQVKRFHAIAREKEWPDEELKGLLSKFGCKHSTEIKMSDYEAICDELSEKKSLGVTQSETDAVMRGELR